MCLLLVAGPALAFVPPAPQHAIIARLPLSASASALFGSEVTFQIATSLSDNRALQEKTLLGSILSTHGKIVLDRTPVYIFFRAILRQPPQNVLQPPQNCCH